MAEPTTTAARRYLPWLVAGAGFAFDLAAFWPGQMSFDSASAWWQARGGAGNDIVPPGFTLAWRIGQWVADGPCTLFVFHLALFWSGIALLAQAWLRSRAAIFAFMLLAGFAPLPLLLRGHVWTDVGLFAALTFACGLLAGAHGVARVRLGLALLALLYANAMRHNALPAIVPLAAWWAALASSGVAPARGQRLRVALVTLAVLGLAVGGNRWLAARAGPHVPLWPLAAEYDLAALSIAGSHMLLPDFMIGDGLEVDELASTFRDWSALPMLTGTRHGLRAPIEPPPLSADERARLLRAWIGAIAAQPWDWLAHRWRVTRALLGTHAPDWPVELVYVDAEYAFRDNPPVAPNGGALHATLMRWARARVATAWLAAWPYLALGVLAAPLAWMRRRHAGAQVALIVLASAWLYLLPLCLLAASAEVRYVAWSCVASLLAFAGTAFALLDSDETPRRDANEHRAALHVQHR